MMEAVACGCPLIAGYVAGLEDMLGTDTEGLTLDPRDTKALATRIICTLIDPMPARLAAERARLRAIERLDWDQVARRYADLLEAARASPKEARYAADK